MKAFRKLVDELCADMRASEIYCKCIPHHPKKATKFEIGGLLWIACMFLINEYLKYNYYEWWQDSVWIAVGGVGMIFGAFLVVMSAIGRDVRDLNNLERYIKSTSRHDPEKFNKFQKYAMRKHYRVRFDEIPDELR